MKRQSFKRAGSLLLTVLPAVGLAQSDGDVAGSLSLSADRGELTASEGALTGGLNFTLTASIVDASQLDGRVLELTLTLPGGAQLDAGDVTLGAGELGLLDADAARITASANGSLTLTLTLKAPKVELSVEPSIEPSTEPSIAPSETPSVVTSIEPSETPAPTPSCSP